MWHVAEELPVRARHNYHASHHSCRGSGVDQQSQQWRALKKLLYQLNTYLYTVHYGHWIVNERLLSDSGMYKTGLIGSVPMGVGMRRVSVLSTGSGLEQPAVSFSATTGLVSFPDQYGAHTATRVWERDYNSPPTLTCSKTYSPYPRYLYLTDIINK